MRDDITIFLLLCAASYVIHLYDIIQYLCITNYNIDSSVCADANNILLSIMGMIILLNYDTIFRLLKKIIPFNYFFFNYYIMSTVSFGKIFMVVNVLLVLMHAKMLFGVLDDLHLKKDTEIDRYSISMAGKCSTFAITLMAIIYIALTCYITY